MKRTLKEWRRYRGLFYIIESEIVNGEVVSEATPIGQKEVTVVFNDDSFLELRAVNNTLFIWSNGPVVAHKTSGCCNGLSVTTKGHVGLYTPLLEQHGVAQDVPDGPEKPSKKPKKQKTKKQGILNFT
jgi:hypothetical protein